jgi:hypothetical protein
MRSARPASRFVPHVLTASAIAALLALAACGGGGGGGSSGTSVSTFTSGPITGFGSIVVNGVHYDDSPSRVEDEDASGRDRSELKLGMVVEIDAGNLSTASGKTTATADRIGFSSLVRGPIASVNVGANQLVVLGQTVTVTPTTVYEDGLTSGISSSQLTTGAIVKVYGVLDSTSGSLTATRIELEDAGSFYRLRGLVGNYDSTARTITIGTAVIDVSGVTVPTSVVNGSLVRIKMSTTLNGLGQYVATQVRAGRGNPENIGYSEIEGTVTAYTSNAAFSVDGIPVNATSATFEDAGSLALGARVEVKGSIVSGQFVATKVEVKTESEQESEGFELEGRITSVDTTAQTFVLRGVTISYAGSVTYERGNVAQLIATAKVDVHGELASDGTTINATSIKFED